MSEKKKRREKKKKEKEIRFVSVCPRSLALFFLFFLTFGKCEKKRAENASEQGGRIILLALFPGSA